MVPETHYNISNILLNLLRWMTENILPNFIIINFNERSFYALIKVLMVGLIDTEQFLAKTAKEIGIFKRKAVI